MENVQRREELINKIKNINDKNVIDEVYRLLEIDFDDTTYQLNELQRREIAQAREEIKKGKGIPSSQANQEIDEWLKR